MQELVMISGKGGTGKTSITAALATLAHPLVLVDADVDVPDLHILAAPQIDQRHVFSGGRKAQIVVDDCYGCGRCAAECRFDAIHKTPNRDGASAAYAVDPISCEGCGAYVAVCPTHAIRFEAVFNGEWFTSRTRWGPMVHARLDAGGENSGKLVTKIRREAGWLAKDNGLSLILVDGSPGVGCPVIASLTNADLALIVAEPTLSGRHDALRVIELAGQLRVPAALCINRWNLNPALTMKLEAESAALGARLAGRVREDHAAVKAQMQGLSLIEYGQSAAVQDIVQLWNNLHTLLHQTQNKEQPCPP